MMRVLLAVLMALFVAVPSHATQAQTFARINGVVRDGQLRPMANIEVTLDAREGPRVQRTGDDGAFTFDSIVPGRVLIVARREGFGMTRRYEYRLRAGQVQDLEILLYEITNNTRQFIDPDAVRPIDFSGPRGLSLGINGGIAQSAFSIERRNDPDYARGSGTSQSLRLELAYEFDHHWSTGGRAGYLFGSTGRPVNFRYNNINTISFQEYRTDRLDWYLRYMLFRGNRRYRPYGSASFGVARFSGDVNVTQFSAPARLTGNGIVLTFGAGVEVALGRKAAVDIGLEWAGSSYEEWELNSNLLEMPNAQVMGTQLLIGIRWWPRTN